MKNLVLGFFLMMSPLVTMAGTAKPLRIACHFTEPFIVVQIDDSRVKHSDFDSLVEVQIEMESQALFKSALIIATDNKQTPDLS